MCNSKDSFLETEKKEEILVSWEKYYEMYREGDLIGENSVCPEILSKFEPEKSVTKHDISSLGELDDLEINTVRSGVFHTGSQDGMDTSMWMDEMWGVATVNKVKYFEVRRTPFTYGDLI